MATTYSIYYIVASFGVGFLLGSLLGWVASGENFQMSPVGFRRIVAVLITTIWVFSVISEVAVGDYTVSIYIHGIMGAVAGYFFSEQGLLNIGGGGGGGSKK